jgi:hypothetical protein
MAKVEYEIDDELKDEVPSQQEFEALLMAMQPLDLKLGQVMKYLTDNGLFEAIALEAPLLGDWFDHAQ